MTTWRDWNRCALPSSRPFFIIVIIVLYFLYRKKVELIQFTVPHHIRPESRLFFNKTENITKPSCNIWRKIEETLLLLLESWENPFVTLLLHVRGKIKLFSLRVTITLLMIRTGLLSRSEHTVQSPENGHVLQHKTFFPPHLSSIGD